MRGRTSARRRLPAAVLAALALSASGCDAAARRAPAARPDASPAVPVALFFGSSTVVGLGASVPERRWTTLLSQGAGWREVNAGLTGSLLTDAAGGPPVAPAERRWRTLPRSPRPSVVVVLYGANDVRRDVPLGEVGVAGTFRNAAASVLAALRGAYPEARLVVVTPQPAWTLLDRRAPYDAALEGAAREAGAVLIRGEEAFPREALEAMAADAIHLNDAGHAAFAAHVARALAAARLLEEGRAAR